jgi:erythronate-4-phosphate dehydrogenase
MKIIADKDIPYIQDYFSHDFDLILKSGRHITKEDVKEADILLVRSVTTVNSNLLSGTRIKFVGTVTSGHDHLDTAWLDQAGIAYAAAKGFNAPPVADYVVSVIAALQKKGISLNKKMKAAIIGVGDIGRLVDRYLKNLNYETQLCDPIRAQNEIDFVSCSLDEIEDVDLISLHVPLTRDKNHPTFHMIDKHFLKRQREGCLLLNASRGAVIHTDDLLSHGQHLHWCFDVWEHEPYINKAILKQALIATPHIAGYSKQSKMRGINLIYQFMVKQKIIPSIQKKQFDFPMTEKRIEGNDDPTWQDIVLDVFNPSSLTELMQHELLNVSDTSQLFEEMRRQFNQRNEFAFIRIKNQLAEQERRQLSSLSFLV